MKKDIHPDYGPTCFVDVSTGNRFLTQSTVKADKTEDIDGVSHKMIICDITSDSHPVFTGEKRFVDTAGRVEKFQKKFSRGRRG
ncbi:MAG: type B 50S ribosomal protein L31 [Verrucomicrobiota bacterium]